ncbi:FAD/NAD(P)-binding domain-containing protein [Gymnopus androsaceus JB14]|uniref:FAD/NAD(P)-binding domain-containing protein n=1 Tax=Gymnopus androsaceus JB14 TaxID=1447944 RepID=A0A6A4I345_9AGAR|nr:FAD/NAD(P)-binding domain-containing protein [Gymnopus androsaceus JB14]
MPTTRSISVIGITQLRVDYAGEFCKRIGLWSCAYSAPGRWQLAHCILSNLEGLKGFPKRVGILRNPDINHGLWAAQRKREAAFEDKEPTVMVVGAGQGGLAVVARLKMLDVSTLITKKNKRVGDNWRNRYKALCLHNPVWANQLPYFPFPSNWPVFSSADKIAGWLEYYGEAMELNVSTSCKVSNAVRDEALGQPQSYPDGRQRIFKNIKHIVFTTGFNGSQPNIPLFPGTDSFKGQILHSSQYKLASEYIGKKVVVIGACTSAHDIATDLHRMGIDVTMYQRSSTYVMSAKNKLQVYFSGLLFIIRVIISLCSSYYLALYSENSPPTDVSDLMSASFPNSFSVQGFSQQMTDLIADMDKDLLEGLSKRGFKLNKGINGTGGMMLYLTSGAWYYLDTGASQLIIDRKIKLKSDRLLQSFTEKGLRFEDGSEIPADVVVYTTGEGFITSYGDAHTVICQICGDQVAKQRKDVWGLNAEGELRGSWRDMGVPGLFYTMVFGSSNQGDGRKEFWTEIFES